MNDSEYLKKLGERIKEFRTKKSMRQVDLADKIGIEDSALRRIESGRVNSTINMLRKVAVGLEVSLLELLDL